jgi:hypothetical protein
MFAEAGERLTDGCPPVGEEVLQALRQAWIKVTGGADMAVARAHVQVRMVGCVVRHGVGASLRFADL